MSGDCPGELVTAAAFHGAPEIPKTFPFAAVPDSAADAERATSAEDATDRRAQISTTDIARN